MNWIFVVSRTTPAEGETLCVTLTYSVVACRFTSLFLALEGGSHGVISTAFVINK